MKQIIPFVKDLNFNTRISEITSIALEHNLQFENNDSIVGNFIISGKYKINDISVSQESFEKEIPFDITLDDKYDASKVEIDIDDFYYEIVNEEFLRVHIDVLANNLVYFKEEVKVENKDDVREEIAEEDDEIIEEDDEIIEEKEDTTLDYKEELDVQRTADEEKVIITDNNKNDLEITKEDKSDNAIKENNKRKEQTQLVENNKTDDISVTNEVINNQNVVEEKEEKTLINNFETSFLNQQEKYSTYKVHIIRENETIETIKKTYNISSEELEKYNSLDKIVMGSKLVIPILDEQQ